MTVIRNALINYFVYSSFPSDAFSKLRRARKLFKGMVVVLRFMFQHYCEVFWKVWIIPTILNSCRGTIYSFPLQILNPVRTISKKFTYSWNYGLKLIANIKWVFLNVWIFKDCLQRCHNRQYYLLPYFRQNLTEGIF